jgi:hypothetical protein
LQIEPHQQHEHKKTEYRVEQETQNLIKHPSRPKNKCGAGPASMKVD